MASGFIATDKAQDVIDQYNDLPENTLGNNKSALLMLAYMLEYTEGCFYNSEKGWFSWADTMLEVV